MQRPGLFGVHKKRDFLILYTLVFALLAVLTHIYIYVSGKTLVWNLDGSGQHIKTLAFYGEWLRETLRHIFVDHEFSVPAWSFSIGYGADVPATLSFYVTGDPFALLAVFVPVQYTYYLYEALIYLRVWCMGLAFSTFCFGKNKDVSPYAVLASSFAYSFCGFAMHNTIRHPFFLTPMVILPLIFIGVDHILEKKSPWLYIFGVFFAAVSNFYFFYMVVILTVLYAGFEMFIPLKGIELKKTLTNIGALAGYAVIGVMMSAVLLLPVILSFSGDSRTENKVIFDALYPVLYYENFLSGFLSYQSVQGGEWANLGYASPALAAIFLLYRGKTEDAERKRLRVAFAVLTLFFMIPAVQYVFNGMSYPSARWHFGYSLLVAYILTHMWPEITRLTKKSVLVPAIGLAVYFAACMIMPMSRTLNVTIQLVIAGITVAVIFLLSRKEGGKKKFPEFFVLGAVIVSILANGVFGFIEWFNPDIAPTTLDQSQVADSIDPEECDIMNKYIDKSSFSRYSYVDGDIITTCNHAMMAGLYSTGFYMSMVSPAISKAYEENLVELKMVSRFMGPDSRTALETLGSVRYVVALNPMSNIPYGFEEIGEEAGKHTGRSYTSTAPGRCPRRIRQQLRL